MHAIRGRDVLSRPRYLFRRHSAANKLNNQQDFYRRQKLVARAILGRQRRTQPLIELLIDRAANDGGVYAVVALCEC